MRNDRLFEFEKALTSATRRECVFTEERQKRFYTKGIRVGEGHAFAVVFPQTLLEFWRVLEVCIAFDKVIIVQAANTGLTGGSTPDGDDYDRDVVVINTLHLDQVVLLNDGIQVLAFAGSSLHQLEDKLAKVDRGPHSVIGSSCIGASVVGGVCNNSGGNLVNRGPAYTELALFARINDQGKLELVNHLEIELGSSPEEILTNLQETNFRVKNLPNLSSLASDINYQERVRDINSATPSRFNADERRLFEASGCAGKVAVFAVRLDTFPLPSREQVFFIGTNESKNLTQLRKKILLTSESLPDMGEYMHRSYFDGASEFCKDTFLFIKYFGTRLLPMLLTFKRRIDAFASSIGIFPDNISDRLLQLIAQILPNHLPVRIREYRDKYEHYMLILASNSTIEEIQTLLDEQTNGVHDYEYIKCTESEGRDALLHRYVAGSAPTRFQVVNSNQAGGLLPLDVALPRNCESWDQILPAEILSQMAVSFKMGHFLCMVFHWDFVVKKGVDVNALKEKILEILDHVGAKYPAEHNVGHLYKASEGLANFYRHLDPTNSFNCGIGFSSKKKFYK